MENQNQRGWSRLDNVAKAFPPTSEKSDTRVFRFGCQLTEDVDPEALQRAVDKIIINYPHFLVVIRMGIFWYYFEQSELRPTVFEEDKPPCSPVYVKGQKNLLFEISYFKKRINLEVFHAITDGTGAMNFLKDIVASYLNEKYGTEILIPDTASVVGKASDDFRKYYNKPDAKKTKTEKIRRAYNIKGRLRPCDDILVTEGVMSVKQAIELSHKLNTTLTGLLAAIYIESIVKTIPQNQRSTPVMMAIPVNLRNFFPSETSRNFFAIASFKYIPSEHSGSLEEICETVNAGMKTGVDKDLLTEQINANGAIEHNIFARLSPLPLKDAVIRAARHISDRTSTAIVSNSGQVKMPPEADKYIDMFTFFTSTLTQQICVCSYKDKLAIGFTAAFTGTEIQKNFFRRLTELGAEITLNCNDFDRS